MSNVECYVIALYIRLSIEDSKVDSLSIQNQRSSLRKFAENLNVDGNVEIVEFVDNGYTGTNFERPAVQELFDLVRSFKIHCIIVKDFSRFGRNRIETGYFLERVFPLYHVRFISVNDDFDTVDYAGDTGGMDVAMKYLINEYYSIDMSRKTKSAKYTKMKRGEYLSSICPYGYRKGQDNRMEIDEEAARVVRHIFNLALAGHSAPMIVESLYKEGVPTPGEYKASKGQFLNNISRSHHIWQRSTVLRFLADEQYIGTYIKAKRAVTEIGSSRVRLKDESEWIKIPNHHPPIVTPEIFAQVQARLKHFKCGQRMIYEYPLRTKVYCGSCGHAMNRMKRKKPVFACQHSKIDAFFPCHGLEVDENELQIMLFRMISKQAEVVLKFDHSGNELDLRLSEHSECDRRIQDCKGRKRQLYEQFVLNEIAQEEFRYQNAVLDTELTNLNNALASLAGQADQLRLAGEKTVEMFKIANIAANTNCLTKELVDLLIDKVLVFPENRIEIIWKIEDFCNGVSREVYNA